MCEGNKTFQCPICVKGKYKESSLIQHLLDKHPDFPATKKIRNDYQFPMACPLCSQKIPTAVALMTHYKLYHLQEYQSLKILLGFDFLNVESKFNSSEKLDIIPNMDPISVYILQNDEKTFQVLNNLISKSPIMHSVLQTSDIMVIGCSKGIILIDLRIKGLGQFFDQCVKGKQPTIEFNTPKESQYLLSEFGISLPTNIKTDPFICQNYTQFVRAFGPKVSNDENVKIDINKSISRIDLRFALINIAIAYHYLIMIGFYPSCEKIIKKSNDENSIKCPCCDLIASNIVSIYRHLFRVHPFPAMIMNKYKMAEQSKGVFICDFCHETNLSNFDDLIIHVYQNHRCDLLKKTLDYIDAHQDIKEKTPDLEPFIRSEYKKIVC